MARLREDPADFLALVAATAQATNYPEAWVEKDYWILETLRSLAIPYADYLVVFKGGTSLSKAWRLIARMSQDVDVLLVPPDGASRSGNDRALKEVVTRAAGSINAAEIPVTSSKGFHRAARLSYAPVFTDPSISPDVLLELGVRGGPNPNRLRTVRSFVAEYAIGQAGVAEGEYADLSPVDIHCLAPERTLVEKLAAVHSLAVQAERGEPIEIGTKMRHYYDLAMLLGDSDVRKSLADGVVAEIANDVHERSLLAEWPSEPRPADGYSTSPAFGDAFVGRGDVSAAYARVLDLVIGGERPTLPTVVERVRASADLL